ncbi:hypothetical protein PRK78_004078 [Emydomyces testavorans]|uniref:Uncharacterized protein n=1 Tax=Emydomyces testavorans TaxID=2070801 RepID=A0AAF0DKG6_9EURO|nr:hypothetical protein PRK78_004078 [Emydomyces testavorans]
MKLVDRMEQVGKEEALGKRPSKRGISGGAIGQIDGVGSENASRGVALVVSPDLGGSSLAVTKKIKIKRGNSDRMAGAAGLIKNKPTRDDMGKIKINTLQDWTAENKWTAMGSFKVIMDQDLSNQERRDGE